MDLNYLIELGPFKTSVVEVIAVIFGLASVWSMKKESILAFPFGIINVLVYVYICFSAKLYAYAGINLFYFIMSQHNLLSPLLYKLFKVILMRSQFLFCSVT